ncbi:hypothetical protein CVT24_000246 [Panaeolus cyanescens]|uniref:Uncharacterized protein n=1 Tax=Panaeolus cyanescens TaxID=181874 RepID=A0A409X9L3_9AGAR|nr:hypothetical protein CVT24_000246 [Panaeolus cyanescens]
MDNLFDFSLPFTSAQPLPPDVSQPTSSLHVPTNLSSQFKVTTPESAVLISAIKTLEGQVQALVEQNLALQASNLMNQQWMKRSRIALETKEKREEKKKKKEGNEVLKFPKGDAVLVTRDEFLEQRVEQEKEKKAKVQQKQNNEERTKLWEEAKEKWDQQDAERQEEINTIKERHAKQVAKWEKMKENAQLKGTKLTRAQLKKPPRGPLPPKVVRMTKKAFIESLRVFGEEEDNEEDEAEASEGSTRSARTCIKRIRGGGECLMASITDRVSFYPVYHTDVMASNGPLDIISSLITSIFFISLGFFIRTFISCISLAWISFFL